MSCAGAPIRNPLTRRLEGILDLTCYWRDANPLMRVVAEKAVRDIEERMLDEAGALERALLTEFLAVRRRGTKPVISVADDILITNRAADRLLQGEDRDLLRAYLAELPRSARPAYRLNLSSGQVVRLHSRPVRGEAGLTGAVVEIDEAVEPRQRGTPPPVPAARLPGLAGDSIVWRRTCQAVTRRCRGGQWIVLTGEPGVGKLALAQAAHRHVRPRAPLHVFDLAQTAEEAGWSTQAAAAMAEAGTCVVLRHIDRAAPRSVERLAGLLADTAGRGGRAWVVATVVADTPLDTDHDILRHFAAAVRVPPLRHHANDIPEIVAALLRRHAPGKEISLAPEALRTLMHREWPGNVRQLDEVLRVGLTRRRSAQIHPDDLPAAHFAEASRVLTPMEWMERDAIVHALLEAEGDKAEAAARLGISRATIYRKIRAYGIEVEPRSDEPHRGGRGGAAQA
jgi:transcriptional regulator of acetoin/glycerol metabolism